MVLSSAGINSEQEFNSTQQHKKKVQILVYKAWKTETAEELIRDGYDKWEKKINKNQHIIRQHNERHF